MSFYRPYVRPIKRGKQGKKVEFGGKGALVHGGGFLFLDYFEHLAFAEENQMEEHLLGYVERFGKLPRYATMDTKYGTLDNQELIDVLKVRASFKARGGDQKRRMLRIAGLRGNRGNAIG